MGVPLTSSVCLFRRRGLLQKHLAEVADYLFQPDEASLDPGLASLQCGRRNDALKLWAAWKYFGDDGYGARVENMMAMALYAANRVKRSPVLKLIREPESINVCFAVEGVEAPLLCRALHERGRAMVGYASAQGIPVVRVAVASPTTTEALDDFFLSVEQVAREIGSEAESA